MYLPQHRPHHHPASYGAVSFSYSAAVAEHDDVVTWWLTFRSSYRWMTVSDSSTLGGVSFGTCFSSCFGTWNLSYSRSKQTRRGCFRHLCVYLYYSKTQICRPRIPKISTAAARFTMMIMLYIYIR